MFVEGNKKRIFINTALGCDSKCEFCYLPSQSFPIGNRPKLSISFDQAIKKLIYHPHFIRGKFGTILSIGCYSECWSNHNKNTTIELIKSLIVLGNPIQLATKRIVSKEELISLNKELIWKGQLTIFISSTTVSEYKTWEKSTSDPYKRFNIFRENGSTKIPLCLYLKPILPNITINDILIYIEYIKSYNLQTIVGTMFTYEENTSLKVKAPIPSKKLFTTFCKDEDTIFNTLFDLNLHTYHNSVEAIEFWRELQMTSSFTSQIKSNHELLLKNNDLNNYLFSCHDPEKVIFDLLTLYGYIDIDIEKKPNTTAYCVNYDHSKTEILTLDTNSPIKLEGIARDKVLTTYKLLRLIETDLQDALLYPHDLRQKIITSIITDLNIDNQTYKRILNNWTSE